MKIPKSKSKEAAVELHDAFKTYAGIDSLTELDTKTMESYLGMVRMLCARERGWLVPLPGEPENIADMSMREFLNLTLKEDERR